MLRLADVGHYFSRLASKLGITKQRLFVFLIIVVICAGITQGLYLVSRVLEYQRLGRSYPEAGDFMVHYRWVQNVLTGLNPFEGAIDQEVPRLIFPAEFFWLLPFAVIPVDYVPKVMLVINLIFGGVLFWASQYYSAHGRFGQSFSKTAAPSPMHLHSDEATVDVLVQRFIRWMWFALFLLSQPVMKVLSNGNVSLISSVLIFFSLMNSRPWVAGFCLSVASVLKVSLVPLYGLVLLARRHYATCLIAASLFALWCLAPFFFRNFNMQLYIDFFDIMFNHAIKEGYNTYVGGGGYDLVNFDFIKYQPINILVKSVFVCLFCVATWRERSCPYYDVSYLLLVSCVSSMILYHRGHDTVLVQLFLILMAQRFFMHRQWMQFAFPFALAVYMCIPLSWLMRVAAHLGQSIGENSWVYLGNLVLDHSGDFVSMLPLPGINLFVISVYAVYAYFGRRHLDRA